METLLRLLSIPVKVLMVFFALLLGYTITTLALISAYLWNLAGGQDVIEWLGIQ